MGALEGTAAGLELRQAQAHLRQQYADTRPLLDKLLEVRGVEVRGLAAWVCG